jgi:hypothetical protein
LSSGVEPGAVGGEAIVSASAEFEFSDAGGPAAAPAVKATGVVGGMLAGADSIDGLDVLRHGGMAKLFTGVRAPSTLGTFLRSFTFGALRS